MKVHKTPLEGVVVLEPKVFGDSRGFFCETYNEKVFKELGLPTHFAQDNLSRSSRGVLRGLHFQDPNPQGKLVRCLAGKVWDVVVDIRKSSPTFGKHFGIELSEENKTAMYVPEGFAHGFLVLSESADFFYKCTALYSPKDEHGLRWDDPDLKIDWPIKDVKVSDKDQKNLSFREWQKL